MRRTLLIGPLLALLVTASALASAHWLAPRLPAPGAELGIAVDGLHLSGAGYLLDLRFTVLDPAKAAPLLARASGQRPQLLVERNGARLGIPSSAKIGSLRQTSRAPQAGRSYFVLFANPGRHVRPGERVSLVLGEQHIAGLRVEP